MNAVTRVALAIVFAGGVLSAQLTTGSVTGAVNDSSGAVIRNARITLSNPGTGVARQSVSNDAGNFRFLQLPVGAYTIEVSSAGFKTFRREGIIVETDRS